MTLHANSDRLEKHVRMKLGHIWRDYADLLARCQERSCNRVNKGNGNISYVDSNVATLTYTYNSNLKMEEKYRIKNPLGFQVTSYRVDPDASPAVIPKEKVGGLINSIPEIDNTLPSNTVNSEKTAMPTTSVTGNEVSQ